ncbi:hypothetical protein Pcac1_g21848 [Phytophthora cactorum]|uniref:Armadillo-type fold n=1 Tax=Phytophthora cactorum TaxID=29920 RepID=A0A329T4X8_9STRA|nr:hypothetical protein Pcac1_g21848 [Phytophthora cactorum]KAG2848877.1 hypothetical protein PC112_g475 [Phytophthora cactorum]KAG2934688.1 hypothetical protein PC114_g846 [Phytophthora cactorum]KAG2944952.1 hypothetical protein PC115_g97 [Phytophthora cactorum]KAG3000603.1 hypothetical protein PC118_g147 [Phytophthora cactorum]
MAARNRDGDSAGRLVRVLGDCDLFHMEAAIASVKPGIRSESLLKPSSGDDVDVLGRTSEGRVLSLSDHKRIARLQAALSTVANAYNVKDNAVGARENNSSRNLVCMVAEAAMMQSMRDCTTSRANCCIWGPQAEKLHVLLDWMMNCERGNGRRALSGCDYVRQLLFDWIHPTAGKQKQLAACLTLFELLQRRRRKLRSHEAREESVCLLCGHFEAFLSVLRGIVERGTIRVGDSHRAKPSKLALIALETLILLCGDVAVQCMNSNEAAKTRLVEHELIHEAVESMRFCLVMLRQWHLYSARRQFLGYALQHLQEYVAACDSVLSSVNQVGDDTTGVCIGPVLDMLCWHWETTAPVLCTRSDAFSRLQKLQPSKVLARVLEKWTFDTFETKEKSGSNSAVVNPEVVYAQLRYVCILMDSIGGVKGCSKSFGNFPAEIKAKFVFFYVQGLATATKNGNGTTVLLILKVLRTLLLPSDSLNLLSSRDEEQGLLSQLLRLNSNTSIPCGSQAQTELELFVADLIASRGLFITEIMCRVHGSHTRSIMNAISLVRTFLYQLDSSATQPPLYQHWRKQLTPGVLNLITHENYGVRRLALSCLPSLDALSCIAGLTATGIHETGNQVVSSALGYLFSTSTPCSREVMVSWFIAACQFGGIQAHLISSKVPASPREWSDYSRQLGGNVKERIAAGGKRKELQERLISFCFSPTGWSNYVRLTNARSEVLCILLRKIFGSPRDPALLRMLREFTASGWVSHEVFEVMAKQICSHMMNTPRLTEEVLDDNSPSAAKAMEGLLFSRLAPLLVLRMLPRGVFGSTRAKILSCGCVDLDHLNEYIDRQLQVDDSDSEAISEVKMGVTSEVLFHCLARSVVDPLEFKEVKMLATECLSKFPPPLVLPFVFAYVVAFLREATLQGEQCSSLVVEEDSVPDSCGLVTAKLMVYYLNRIFSEDEHAYKDCDISSKALVLLVQVLAIESDDALVTDLQRGCIDCIALILSRLAANDSGQEAKKVPTASASSLMNMLITWIFGIQNGEDCIITQDVDGIDSRVQRLFERMWSEARYDQLPLQVRICCCNVLLSAISRSENSGLASWKAQGFISRIALATESCSEESVVAGGLQIIFSFLYKASDFFSIEDNGDLQLVRMCFETTAARLESTRSESIAMNGLKVVGALIGKLPGFMETLSSEDLQQLIDRCLITVRDRQVSPVVTELAQSLLQAMTPP